MIIGAICSLTAVGSRFYRYWYQVSAGRPWTERRWFRSPPWDRGIEQRWAALSPRAPGSTPRHWHLIAASSHGQSVERVGMWRTTVGAPLDDMLWMPSLRFPNLIPSGGAVSPLVLCNLDSALPSACASFSHSCVVIGPSGSMAHNCLRHISKLTAVVVSEFFQRQNCFPSMCYSRIPLHFYNTDSTN